MHRQLRFVFFCLYGIVPVISYAEGDTTEQSTAEGPPAQAAALSPEAVTTIQQQRQQLADQFAQQLQGVSPEARLTLIDSFRKQLSDLLAPLQPPALTIEQQAQQIAQQQAAQQTVQQSLPAEQQQVLSAIQQRQQLIQQLVNTTPEERLAIIAQIHQAATQIEAVGQSVLSETERAQAQATLMAALPNEMKAQIQATDQRRQAIQAAMQLSPDERLAAIQAIQGAAVASGANSTTAGSTPSQP
jgi:hypothetical protein